MTGDLASSGTGDTTRKIGKLRRVRTLEALRRIVRASDLLRLDRSGTTDGN